MVKNRGLEEAKVKLGDLEKIIEKLLERKKVLNVFESGCGYGKVMVQLKKKFGKKINIMGMNLIKEHGDKKKLISFALEEGLIGPSEKIKLKDIKIIFGDAGERIPFKKGSIDLVYSQSSVYLYRDKMRFLEEVARVLAPGGKARITFPDENRKLPEDLRNLLRIYSEERLVSFREFISRFKSIRVIKLKGNRDVLEILPSNLKFGLDLVSALDVHELNRNWFGVVSFYFLN